MNNINPIPTEREYPLDLPNKICWSSIFAGTFIAVGLGFLLHLYSSAIGLSAYSSTPNGASVIAVGGFLGLLVGTIAAMVTAGFVTGYLGRYHYHHVSGGIIYGFITWSLALFLTVIISGATVHFINSYTNSITHNKTNIAPKVYVADKTAADNDSPVPTYQNSTDAKAKKVSPTELAWSGWIVFVLFFIGALSTCIGAIWGMKFKKEVFEHHPL